MIPVAASFLAGYAISFVVLLIRLRNHHSAIYGQLGKPGIVDLSIGRLSRVLELMIKRGHRKLGDPFLSAISDIGLICLAMGVLLFVLVLARDFA